MRRDRSSRGREYMHNYGLFTLLYERDQYSTVKIRKTKTKRFYYRFHYVFPRQNCAGGKHHLGYNKPLNKFLAAV